MGKSIRLELEVQPLQIEPLAYLGTWRRFGPAGPVYEIIGIAGQDGEGDHLKRIRVLDSGEEANLRPTDIINDPTKQ